MKPMQKIGRGSYGDVYFLREGVVAKKVDRFDRNRSNVNGYELTTLCEIAVLSIAELHEYFPRLLCINKEPYAFYIQMQDCGDTIQTCAREYTLQTRTELLPKIALKLTQTTLLMKEFGMHHNDIKSSNVMMCAENTVRLIDFGLCLFETPQHVDSNLIAHSKPDFNLSPEWGTYAIMPPEAFLEHRWSSEHMIPWSIGITLCEFLFETHSFIRDYVLEKSQHNVYDAYYKNDLQIQAIFSELFQRKMKNGEKYLIDFTSYNMFSAEIVEFMNGLLTLDYTKRTTLNDMLKFKIFHRFTLQKFNEKLRGIKNTVLHVRNEKPIHVASLTMYMDTRTKALNWMFDMLMACNKLQCFTLAVKLFDKHLGIMSIMPSRFLIVSAACVYISQIKSKTDVIHMPVLIKASKWFEDNYNISADSINNCIDEIIAAMHYKIYLPTVDSLLLNEFGFINMELLLQTQLELYPPYNNHQIIQIYKTKLAKISKT